MQTKLHPCDRHEGNLRNITINITIKITIKIQTKLHDNKNKHKSTINCNICFPFKMKYLYFLIVFDTSYENM